VRILEPFEISQQGIDTTLATIAHEFGIPLPEGIELILAGVLANDDLFPHGSWARIKPKDQPLSEAGEPGVAMIWAQVIQGHAISTEQCSGLVKTRVSDVHARAHTHAVE